jgi:hypothetical protein
VGRPPDGGRGMPAPGRELLAARAVPMRARTRARDEEAERRRRSVPLDCYRRGGRPPPAGDSTAASLGHGAGFAPIRANPRKPHEHTACGPIWELTPHRSTSPVSGVWGMNGARRRRPWQRCAAVIIRADKKGGALSGRPRLVVPRWQPTPAPPASCSSAPIGQPWCGARPRPIDLQQLARETRCGSFRVSRRGKA